MDKTKQAEWTLWLNARAAKYWAEYRLVFSILHAFECPKIILNNRLSSTAGRNHPEENKIDLGTKFLAHSKEYATIIHTEILPHEMAHQIDYNLNGWPIGNRWHRDEWKVIMVKIGQKPERCHSMDLKK